MSEAAEALHTSEEYLELERKAEYKSEFLGGRIYAMSGASSAHNRISFNIAGLLHAQLRGGSCNAYIADMRVKIGPTGAYVYPDVAALCDKPRFEDAELDTLVNPALVVEVLSPSTEAYDRGAKFSHYRGIESLREYVLVAQDRRSVVRYARLEDQWIFDEFNDPADRVRLESIGCDLALCDIYEGVAFE